MTVNAILNKQNFIYETKSFDRNPPFDKLASSDLISRFCCLYNYTQVPNEARSFFQVQRKL